MKRFVFFLLAIMTMTFCHAQNDEPETSHPSVDTEIVRRCSFIDIEGKFYSNVIVTLKSTRPDYLLTDKYKVKVKVTDEDGKKIYKKTFSNCYLYVYSNGQIQVGIPKFNKVIISPSSSSWYGEIKEKEGVW